MGEFTDVANVLRDLDSNFLTGAPFGDDFTLANTNMLELFMANHVKYGSFNDDEPGFGVGCFSVRHNKKACVIHSTGNAAMLQREWKVSMSMAEGILQDRLTQQKFRMETNGLAFTMRTGWFRTNKELGNLPVGS